MWKPSTVVPQNRKRATFIWACLLLGVVGYTLWQILDIVDKRKHPSTSLSISDAYYIFPLVSVCVFPGVGCGWTTGRTEQCITSALYGSYATYQDEFINVTESKFANCVAFDLTQFNVPEGTDKGKTDLTQGQATATIIMEWQARDVSVPEDEYSTSVEVFLGDEEGEQGSAFVPYSRNIKPSETEVFETTVMTIGKTQKKFLSDAIVVSFPALTISTTETVKPKIVDNSSSSDTDDSLSSTNDDGSSPNYDDDWSRVYKEYAVGSLYLQITQGPFSLTELEDIDPLDIANLLGNIGGFWELLLLCWGVFFIATNRETTPTMKARTIPKPLIVLGTVSGNNSAPQSTGTGNDDFKPAWENASNCEGKHTSEDEKSLQRDTEVPPSRSRPVASAPPKRVSSIGADSSVGSSER